MFSEMLGMLNLMPDQLESGPKNLLTTTTIATSHTTWPVNARVRFTTLTLFEIKSSRKKSGTKNGRIEFRQGMYEQLMAVGT